MLISNFARGVTLAGLLVPSIGFAQPATTSLPSIPANDGFSVNCATGNVRTFGHHPSRGGPADPSLAVSTRHYRRPDAAMECLCASDARQCGEH